MKFPYGLSDFGKIIQNGFFYQDRTHLIPALESTGDQLLFLRPRRFGKSLLLSMLEYYYDVRQADSFESLFGQLAIYANPTPLHHRYYILHWDFSLVKPQGDVKDIERALHQHINLAIRCCASQYDLTVPIDDTNAVQSLGELLKAVRETPYKLYLFIDEYDNFANEVLMARQDHYEALLYGEGLFKTLFKAVKAAAAGQGLDRVFIAGVSPVAMSDITSGYNVAENIYLKSQFNALCGFTESEIMHLLNTLNIEAMGLSKAETLDIMRTFYDGYQFAEHCADPAERIYNPTLSLYFLKHIQQEGYYPREMLDDNLSMDRQRLAYIAGLLGKGNEVFIEALAGQNQLVITRLSRRFGVRDVQRKNQESNVLPSLLYYFGVLTLAG
ncbi:MAG: AAA family ATPase, partial [Methylococcaceae bacterium]